MHAFPLLNLTWLSLGCLLWNTTHAGGVANASVEHHNGRFDIYSELVIDIPDPQVRNILTHYENLPHVNEGIKEVAILERRGPEQVRMKLTSEVCIFFICMDYTWVQDVETLPSGEIVAIIDPEASDFQEGRAMWRFIPENGRTRLVFDAYLVPNFWFPPIIGPWFIKRKLYNAALITAHGIERTAAAR